MDRNTYGMCQVQTYIRSQAGMPCRRVLSFHQIWFSPLFVFCLSHRQKKRISSSITSSKKKTKKDTTKKVKSTNDGIDNMVFPHRALAKHREGLVNKVEIRGLVMLKIKNPLLMLMNPN